MIKKYYIVILFLATMSGISEAIEQQDCEIMQSESGSITLGFKAGTIGFGVGPEITFGSSSGVNWFNIWLLSIKSFVQDITQVEFLKFNMIKRFKIL